MRVKRVGKLVMQNTLSKHVTMAIKCFVGLDVRMRTGMDRYQVHAL